MPGLPYTVMVVVVVHSRRRLGKLLLAVVVVAAVRRDCVAGGQVHSKPSNMGGNPLIIVWWQSVSVLTTGTPRPYVLTRSHCKETRNK